MAANYTLVASQSSIRVISPTVVQDVVVVTIQTLPSRVIADIWIPKPEWDQGQAGNALEAFAANIERIMESPRVVAASSGQSLDASGLLQSDLTFTVGYTTPGSAFPPATVDVTVAASELRPEGAGTSAPGVTAALAEIDAAYDLLAAVAGGATADAAG